MLAQRRSSSSPTLDRLPSQSGSDGPASPQAFESPGASSKRPSSRGSVLSTNATAILRTEIIKAKQSGMTGQTIQDAEKMLAQSDAMEAVAVAIRKKNVAALSKAIGKAKSLKLSNDNLEILNGAEEHLRRLEITEEVAEACHRKDAAALRAIATKALQSGTNKDLAEQALAVANSAEADDHRSKLRVAMKSGAIDLLKYAIREAKEEGASGTDLSEAKACLKRLEAEYELKSALNSKGKDSEKMSAIESAIMHAEDQKSTSPDLQKAKEQLEILKATADLKAATASGSPAEMKQALERAHKAGVPPGVLKKFESLAPVSNNESGSHPRQRRASMVAMSMERRASVSSVAVSPMQRRTSAGEITFKMPQKSSVKGRRGSIA